MYLYWAEIYKAFALRFGTAIMLKCLKMVILIIINITIIRLSDININNINIDLCLKTGVDTMSALKTQGKCYAYLIPEEMQEILGYISYFEWYNDLYYVYCFHQPYKIICNRWTFD